MDIHKLIQSPKMNHLNKFRRKHQIPRDIYRNVLEEMFLRYGDQRKHHRFKLKQREREFVDQISQKFDTFIELLTIHTGKTFKKNPNSSSWDQEWDDSNLDGSFAYNGVTEDF